MSKIYTYTGSASLQNISDLTLDSRKIRAQDAIIELSGNFGTIRLQGIKRNQVIVQPAPDKSMSCREFIIDDCINISVNGNEQMLISSTTEAITGNSVEAPLLNVNGEQCAVSGLVINSAENTEQWTEHDWARLARNASAFRGKHCSISRCLIYNVRRGIDMMAKHGCVAGNVIIDFCEDGIRPIANGVEVSGNTIQNARKSSANGNPHTGLHCDGIQMFKFGASNLNTAKLKNVRITGNRIYNRSDYPGIRAMQGIACFDGLIEDSIISDNEVFTDHAHGITLACAQNCNIRNNLVVSTDPQKVVSHIAIATNKAAIPYESADNSVTNNTCAKYTLTGVPRNLGNQIIDEQKMYAYLNNELPMAA